jgi:hypothetical protein
MHAGHTRRKNAVRQLELVRREHLVPTKTKSVSVKIDDETLRALVALMAEAILAVAQCPEVDDER